MAIQTSINTLNQSRSMKPFEQAVGELTGKMQYVVPALERIEKKQLEQAETLSTIKEKVNSLEKTRRGALSSVWDVIRLVIAAAIGYLLSLLAKG